VGAVGVEVVAGERVAVEVVAVEGPGMGVGAAVLEVVAVEVVGVDGAASRGIGGTAAVGAAVDGACDAIRRCTVEAAVVAAGLT
jgi:hypothetical protein